MKWSTRFIRLIQLAFMLTLYASAAFSQDLKELGSTAKGRIELARASIVTVKMLNERNETISQAEGFLIRKDLIATDLEIDKNSRLQVTVATDAGTFGLYGLQSHSAGPLTLIPCEQFKKRIN